MTVQHTLGHTLTGWLRKLKVETWAVLGEALRHGAPAAEAINACAAYEHAYHTVVVLDPRTLRLCLALGFPPDKLRRWGDVPANDDGDWGGCCRLGA